MNDNLDYTVQDFRRSKLYLFFFIVYIVLSIYLGIETAFRFIISARKNKVESLH
jgi:hypothetical protein